MTSVLLLKFLKEHIDEFIGIHLSVICFPSCETGKADISKGKESEESGNRHYIEDEIDSEYNTTLFYVKGEKRRFLLHHKGSKASKWSITKGSENSIFFVWPLLFFLDSI